MCQMVAITTDLFLVRRDTMDNILERKHEDAGQYAFVFIDSRYMWMNSMVIWHAIYTK